MLIRFMHFLPCAFTCFMHPQPVTGPPFFRDAICNTSPQSIHFFIAYAFRFSFIVCFILLRLTHFVCASMCSMHHTTFPVNSNRSHAPFVLLSHWPINYSQNNAWYLQAYTVINLTNPATEQIKLKHIAFSLMTLILFLFELIHNYFGSENLNLY